MLLFCFFWKTVYSFQMSTYKIYGIINTCQFVSSLKCHPSDKCGCFSPNFHSTVEIAPPPETVRRCPLSASMLSNIQSSTHLSFILYCSYPKFLFEIHLKSSFSISCVMIRCFHYVYAFLVLSYSRKLRDSAEILVLLIIIYVPFQQQGSSWLHMV